MPPPAEGLASRLFLGPTLRTQPDRRLVTLVREGYEVAFEEIVRRYARPLGRYAASIVGSRSEDVLQDAFAKALPALRRDGAEIDLRPWLFRVVRNTALNDLRDRPPTPELLAEALVGGRDPADELERREQLADLMRRLRALPEPQRAAIVMRELEGLGHEEIATALGMTGGGARQAIYRARQALRDGAGLLLPLPLLRLLIDHGTGAAGAGGTIAAGASAGGGGTALKLGVVAAVIAGSVGAGVAIERSHRGATARAGTRQVVADASLSGTGSARTETTSAGDEAGGRSEGGARAGDRGRPGDASAEPGGAEQPAQGNPGGHNVRPGESHGGGDAPGGHQDGGEERHPGGSGEGPSGAGGDRSGDSSSDGGSGSSGESSSGGGESGGDTSTASNNGPGSGSEESSSSGDSGDSGGGDGFSQQAEPQIEIQEEPR